MSTTKASTAPSTAERTQATSVEAAPMAVPLGQQLGNQGLQSLLRARMLQAKLAVSNPNDEHEREADRVAEHVMRTPEPLPPARVSTLQPRTTDSGNELLRSNSGEASVPTVDPATEHSIQSLSGRGRALPESVRSFMETRFNADFSTVRVHTDAHAHELARAVSAQAFTVGPNVVFGAGHYSPDTDSGKRLLAHELTHTIQQGATSTQVARSPQKHGAAVGDKIPYEYTPLYLDGSASVLAEKGWAIIRKSNVDQGHLAGFTLIVVARGHVEIYSTTGKHPKTYEVKSTPPVRGLYMGGPLDVSRSRYVHITGGGTGIFWFGRWAPGEWVTAWSTITAAELAEALHGTVPVLIVGNDATEAPATSHAGKDGGGGGAHDAHAVPHGVRSKVTAANGTGKEAVELREPVSGDEFDEAEGEAANYPAFPAWINVSSALVPRQARNELTMRLGWEYGAQGMVGQVWNASARVRYRWERWDVSNIVEVDAENSQQSSDATKLAKKWRQKSLDPSAQVKDRFIAHDKEARAREFYQQVHNSRRIIDSGGTPGNSAEERSAEVWEERVNIALEDASALASAGGHLVEAFWYTATKPDNTITLDWNVDGTYLVRCIASPEEHNGRRYVPSVATAFVEVRPADYVVKNTLGKVEERLDWLRAKLAATSDPTEISFRQAEIAEVEKSSYGSAVESLQIAVKNKEAEVKTTHGRAREKAQAALDSLKLQVEIAQRNEKRYLPHRSDGTTPSAFRPQAAIVSDVTGQTFPLLLQLIPFFDGPRPYWVIFDVTSSGDDLGHPHGGEGQTNGDAIKQAFHNFARANDYEPGMLVLRIPDAIPNVANRELFEKSFNAAGQLTKKRMQDLVTVLTAASLVVPGAGEVGMLLGGTLGATHIAERWRAGTLRADGALVGDLLAVLGTVGSIAGKISELVIIEANDTYAVALRSGNQAAIKKALRGVTGANIAARGAEIANQMVLYGGLAWGEAEMLEGIKKLNEEERSGALTHSEASSGRAKAVLGAIQGHTLLFTGLWHPPTEHGGETSSHHEGPAHEDAFRPSQRVIVKTPKGSREAPREVVGEEQTARRPGDKAMASIGGPPSGATPPPGGPRPPESAPESPERLFELLARGVDRTPSRVTSKGEVEAPPMGEFRRDMTTADEAYQAYNEALAVSGGSEVAIYYDEVTGEYRVMIGDEGQVRRPDGFFFVALVHFHHNWDNVLTYRLPSPVDYDGLQQRAQGERRLAREFVEYPLPNGGRGRTEYGVDPAHPDAPFYVRISRADGTVDPHIRFHDIHEYARYWTRRTIHVEKGSPEHQQGLINADSHIEAARAAKKAGVTLPSGAHGSPQPAPANGPVPTRAQVRPVPGEDWVIDLRGHRTGLDIAQGEIDSSRQRPSGPAATVSPDVTIVPRNKAPAILFRTGKKVRLITVKDGRSYYMSLGESVSHIEGEPTRKTRDAFYEFNGIQAVKPMAPPHGEEAPVGYHRIKVGWYIKMKGITRLSPVPELRDLTYSLEATDALTRPEDVNSWLASHGATPRNDIAEILGWKEGSSSHVRETQGAEGDDSGSPVPRSEISEDPTKPNRQQAAVDPDPEKGGSNERTSFGRSRQRVPPAAAPAERPPLQREGPLAPERLFEMLERGEDTASRAPAPAHPAGPHHASGTFRRGLTTPDAAYRAYVEALDGAFGREVAIWYDVATGEYAVEIGAEVNVLPPQGEPHRRFWIALVHFHPNRPRNLMFRLPAPVSDFTGLWERAAHEHALVREFVEYDLPNGQRGRTEYGIDLSIPNAPLYIRIHHANGTVDVPLRFRSDAEYAKYYDSRTKWIEPGSPEYRSVVPPRQGGSGGAGGGGRPGGGPGGATEPNVVVNMNHPVPSDVATPETDGDWSISFPHTAPPASARTSHPKPPEGKGPAPFGATRPGTHVPEKVAHAPEEVPELTPEQRGDDILREEIGDYVVIGNKQMDGPVFHRTIDEITNMSGKTNDLRPLYHLIRALIKEATDAHATHLRIDGKMIEAPSVNRIDRLAKLFGGTARNVGGNSNEIIVPLPVPEKAAPAVTHTDVPRNEFGDDEVTVPDAKPIVDSATPEHGNAPVVIVPTVSSPHVKVEGFQGAPKLEARATRPTPPKTGELQVGGFVNTAKRSPARAPSTVKVGGFGRAREEAPESLPSNPSQTERGVFVSGFARQHQRAEASADAPANALVVEGFTRPAEQPAPTGDWAIAFEHTTSSGDVPVAPSASPSRHATATPNLPRARRRPRPGASEPIDLTEQGLQHLASEMFGRPIPDLTGRIHVYPTQEAYLAEHERRFPGEEDPGYGYRDPIRGDLHFPPDVDVTTALHELFHYIRAEESTAGRDYVGEFLDEGATEAIVLELLGRSTSIVYAKNVGFYWLLRRTLGSDVVEIALLHGRYAALRSKLKELFGGSEPMTQRFFALLQTIGIDGNNATALDEAVAMLETASGKPAWQLSGSTPRPAARAPSGGARIDRAGPFSFLGTHELRRQAVGMVLTRRVSAVLRSGLPIATADLLPFFRALVADANVTGAQWLHIFPEFSDAPPTVGVFRRFAESFFGGTAREVDGAIMIEIPLGRVQPPGRRFDVSDVTVERP